MTFTPFASSSAGCAYALTEEGHDPLLIECGLPFRHLAAHMRHRTSQLAGCIVSHAHADHAKAARQLADRGVAVYCSQEAKASIDPTHPDILAIEPDVLLHVGGWRVHPFAAGSDTPGTYGFLIASAREDRLLYVTDAAYVVPRFAGLTHIAIETNHDRDLIRQDVTSPHFAHVVAGHMSIDRACELLEANDLRRVREIHLLHLSDDHSDEEAFASRVRKVTGCPTYVAPRETRP